MSNTVASLADIALLGIDIDGTLTDGTLLWGGPDIGWTQRYAVRDGEAIRRLAAWPLPIVPISRNKTACARARMQMLGLPSRWVGVDDKLTALQEVEGAYNVGRQQICYIGDGREDGVLFAAVGRAYCVRDGHPEAARRASHSTAAAGGCGAVEEVIDLLMQARGWQI